jgi:GntR family transcriptional regulator, rspAB operon transcriptional repressor
VYVAQNQKSKKVGVYEYLKKKIITNSLEQGAPLVESALCKELKISKTPIREAMQQLEKEGLIESIPNRGSFVSRFSFQDIRDLFEIREMLECAVIRRVAERGDFDITKARTICEKFQSASPDGNTASKSSINAGDQIHTFFFEALGNKRLLEYYRGLQEQITRIRQSLLSKADPKRASSSFSEHLEAIEAVIAKDPDRAEKAMRTHLQNSVEVLKSVLWAELLNK